MQANNKVEDLLTDIYSQVDLKGGVFDFIEPYILKSYAILKNDEINKENGRTSEIVFADVEKKHAVEDILFRDLPSIIDIYKKLPLDYRNERKLKNGKNHREFLIENIEILAGKLKELEQGAYEGLDQSMAVKNKVFKEKYESTPNILNIGSGMQYELETEKVNDNFNWNELKGQLPVADLKSLIDNNFQRNDKVKVEERHVEYKVKDKFRAFMSGTYNIYKGMKRAVTSEAAQKAFIISTVPMVGWAMYATATEGPTPMESLVNASQMVRLDNQVFRDASIAKMNDYAKEHGITVTYKGDEMTLATQAGKLDCKRPVQHSVGYNTLDKYNINGLEISGKESIPPDMVDQVCATDNNTVSITKSIKLKH